MMAENNNNMSPNDVASQLIQHTKSFLDDAEDFAYFLPNWVSYRLDTLEALETTKPSNGPLSCITPAASSMGSALINKFAQMDHRVAAAVSTIGNALSFGFTCGVTKGKEEFNNRRLNVVASRMREDHVNTTDFEMILVRVISSLDSVSKDFQACWDLPAEQRDSNDMLRNVGSVLKSPTAAGSDIVQYQALIGWSDQVMKLLQQFLTILRKSRAPNEQIEDLLRRNPTPDVIVGRREFDNWVSDLKTNYYAIENARNAARQNVQGADNLLSRMLTASSSGAATAPKPQAPHAYAAGKSGADHVDECTNEIDRWFEQVRRLIINSIEVAEEVGRLFCEEQIPLIKGSER